MERRERSCYTIYEELENGGVIDKKRLLNFIEEHIKLQESASEVYTEITGGILTASHYPADTVLSVYRSIQHDKIDKNTVFEDMMSIVSDVETRNTISEYFNRAGE